ncbi:MAG: DUF4124 domain-containing protein [Bdellovibrionales bacterium]|nr:DUF4124 domain-containing protein [Massilia sp.]
MKESMMLDRQRGAFNLYTVFVVSAIVAIAALAALFSIRGERNLFAEGAAKAGKFANDAPAAVLESARLAVAPGNGKMRRCVIHGKPVISNTDCSDNNPTSKDITIRETRGFEAPKKPAPGPAQAGSDPLIDKIIENQVR